MIILDFPTALGRILAMLPLPLHSMFHAPRWRRVWAWLWSGLMLVVASVALSPGHAAPSLSPVDKLEHLLAFAALAAAGGLALRAGWRAALVVASSMVAYGGLIELAQTQVPGRVGDWADLLADTIGVMLGLGLVLALRRAWRDTGS